MDNYKKKYLKYKKKYLITKKLIVNKVLDQLQKKNTKSKNNKENDYCDNNGGTYSRCEIKYNGYQLTSIGLGSDFIESYGQKLPYMFYMNTLLSPIKLKEAMNIDFFLVDNNSLEVYGDGQTIKSISIAPFIFKVNFNKKKDELI